MYFLKPHFPFFAKNIRKVGGCTFLYFKRSKQSPYSNLPQKQQGVALITAMIISTIAVSLAGTIMYRQQLQIRLASNISHLEQAYMYVHGMEDWAGTILVNSFNDNDKTYVSLEDDWFAKGQLITFPIDGGTLNGQLIDLQGRINVNSLNRPKPPQPQPQNQNQNQNQTQAGQENQNPVEPEPDIGDINRTRLQNLIGKIDPDQDMGPAENFTDILKDWIDKDPQIGNHLDKDYKLVNGEGAESDYYQSLDPAYFSANTEMISTTELRLLKNMTNKLYKELRKYVSTLPIKNQSQGTADTEIKTKLNINTADKIILTSLNGLTPADADEIIERRESEPFKNMQEFTNFANEVLPSLDPLELEDIDVTSNYFLLRGRVTIINASIPVNSILERKNGKISVIMRDFSVQ